MVEFKEFKVEDLFEEIIVGKQPKQQNRYKDFKKGMYPTITGVTVDNGIGFFSYPEESKLYKGILTLSKDGEYAGTPYIQNEDVILGGHSLGMVPKSEVQGVIPYIASIFRKICDIGYWRSGGVMGSVPIYKLKELKFNLPVKPDGTPDFQHMESYLKEIEQKYIRSLKQKLETDKSNLLKVIGKKEEDIEEVLKTGFNEVSDFKEFKVGDLFNISRGDIKNRKGLGEIKEKAEGVVSFVAQINNDNGFVSYVNKGDYTLFKGNSIVVGRQTGAVYYQKEDFITTDGVLVLSPKFKIDSKIGMYMTSVLGKLMGSYGYNNTVSVSKLKPMNMVLPTIREGEPDFQYMERYISYIELTHTHNFIETERKRIELIEELVHKEDKGEQSGRK